MKLGQSKYIFSVRPGVSVARCRGDDSCVGGYDADNDERLGQGGTTLARSSVSRVGVRLGDSAGPFTVDGKIIEST